MESVLFTIFFLVVFCVAPSGVLWLCKRVSLLGKLGPIMVLYVIGMIIGNLPFGEESMKQVQDLLPNVLIPLAIPMMLYASTFSNKQVNMQLKVVLSGFISVCIAVAAGYVLCGKGLDEGAKIGGIISGMYTGGTLNAAALQAVFQAKSETFVLINSYDIIISFLYLVFLLTFGIRWFRKLYGGKADTPSCSSTTAPSSAPDASGASDISSTSDTSASSDTSAPSDTSETSYRKLRTKEGWVQLLKILGVTVLVAGVSAGVAAALPGNWFMVVFILLISTLGVACSFIPKVKAFDMSYDLGMYLIYIFSITIASMADFSKLNIAEGLGLFGFLSIAVFLSLALHAIFCRMLKVDADSMVVSSVAFINSPPFVPMISASMKNKEALLTGLAAGIVGYAAGTHLGVLMSLLLQ